MWESVVRTPIRTRIVALAFGLLVTVGGVCHASPTLTTVEVLVGGAVFVLLPLAFVETVICNGVMGGAEPFGALFVIVAVANVSCVLAGTLAARQFDGRYVELAAFLLAAIVAEGIVVSTFCRKVRARTAWGAVLFANSMIYGVWTVLMLATPHARL